MPPPQEIAGLIKGLLTIGFPYFFLGGESQKRLGGGFKDLFIFTPKIGEDFHLDEHIFQRGWFNHQLEDVVFLQKPDIAP